MCNTEERIIPGISLQETVQEHIDRYKFALGYVKGKRVLDVACGVGYGSKMLSEVAYYVAAVDISQEAVDYAKEHYTGLNIDHFVADACKLPFEDQEFDVIISFETIEHVENYNKFISEVHRVLKHHGCFICSTPNAKIHSPTGNIKTPYQVVEFTPEQFTNNLLKKFKLVTLHGQHDFNFLKPIFSEYIIKIKELLRIKKTILAKSSNSCSFPVGYFKDGIEKSSFIIGVCYKGGDC